MGKVERERGLVLSSYKQPCLRRRLAVRMRARGVHTYAAYATVLDRTPEEYDLLLDALTINVTKFFRNPETFALLRERVVPRLWAAPGPIAVWSAGCASGEEPYSLAILFAEQARTMAGLRARLRIDATDLDPDALETLRRAEYPAAAVEDVPTGLRERFLTAGPPYRVAEGLAQVVHPVSHDLTWEPAPHPPYHLIVCRNVVIYFDRATQERLFLTFAAAVDPGGLLLLGKVETLLGPARDRFGLEEPRERLYVRR
ncbi:MAG TPA: protein-glutamate O-methyltransferase CheR [Gemmatimonadales bacterium]|nr:protein-glutamate O-methyltransferase CheR [Gemmatimonadales bacterium]